MKYLTKSCSGRRSTPPAAAEDSRFIIVVTMMMLLLRPFTLFATDSFLVNGYLQSRFTDDYRNVTGFAIRRAKLWATGQVPVPGKWFYKVQGNFRYQNSGSFTLQDFYGEYDMAGSDYVRFGQMVPDFSLQRSQPDYEIPVVERSNVVNALIPTAETGGRDIGIQSHFSYLHNQLQASVGVFNGNGGNVAGNDDRKFLLIHRLHFLIPLSAEMKADFGYSLAFRQTSDLAFTRIYGDQHLFRGNDFSWGLEFFINHPKWELQSEFIEACLGNQKANGYYVLGDFNLSPKNQVVASIEKYEDLNSLSSDAPWYILGFNHYIAKNKAKIMFDSLAQFAEGQTNCKSIIQLQLFFN